MMISRDEIVQHWQSEGRAGRLVVGHTVACGSMATCAEQAGLDFLLVDAGAKVELAGLHQLQSLLCCNDANVVTKSLADEILSQLEQTPVIAGLYGQVSPWQLQQLIREIQFAGYHGICNSPSIGYLDGRFRNELESAGHGYKNEIDLIAAASDAGLFTLAQVHDEREAEGMVAAGAEALLLCPCTETVSDGWVHGLVESARAVDPNVLILLKLKKNTTARDVYQMRGVAGVLFGGAMDVGRLKAWKLEVAGYA